MPLNASPASTPQPIIIAGTRAILDVADGAAELAFTLKLVGRGLVDDLHYHGDCRAEASRAALRTLLQAQTDLAGLITGLRGMAL